VRSVCELQLVIYAADMIYTHTLYILCRYNIIIITVVIFRRWAFFNNVKRFDRYIMNSTKRSDENDNILYKHRFAFRNCETLRRILCVRFSRGHLRNVKICTSSQEATRRHCGGQGGSRTGFYVKFNSKHTSSTRLRFSWIWPLCVWRGTRQIHRTPKISTIRVRPLFRGRNALSPYTRCVQQAHNESIVHLMTVANSNTKILYISYSNILCVRDEVFFLQCNYMVCGIAIGLLYYRGVLWKRIKIQN